MTRAAIYARYSSENQREASIADQFRNCEHRAKQEGWEVVQRYHDSALSGSLGEQHRPGYQQMLAGAEAKRLDVLLVDDLSRLSRDYVETERVRRRFVFMGLRLVGVSDGVDTHQKGHKLLSGFKGMMNDVFLDDLRERTSRGMEGQVRKGFHAGGRCYGYKLVPQVDPTQLDPYGQPRRIGTKLEIDSEQAAIVREIFERYADGWSPFKIVDDLNRRKVRPAGAFWKRADGRNPTWGPSALIGNPARATGMLNCRLYLGQVIWRRSRWEKNPDTGRKKCFWRPPAEWVIEPAPHLRIISDELWERVKARQAEVHEQSAAIRKALHDNARIGRGPKYLFSGLLVCAQCQSRFVIADRERYGCSGWLYRGTAVCTNTIKVPRALLETLLLDGIRRDLFTDAALARFSRTTARLLAERRQTKTSDLARATARLSQVERETANLLKAIKAGVLTATTKAELERLEAERASLAAHVNGQEKQRRKVVALLPNLTDRFKALVADLATVTLPQVDRARGILRVLVGKRIALHPASDGRERYLVAELSGDFAGLVQLATGVNKCGGGHGPPYLACESRPRS